MKVVLMMENSQVVKNLVILNEFISVVDLLGYVVFNVGMNSEIDYYFIYVYLGIMGVILFNLKVVDFVILGCGMG